MVGELDYSEILVENTVNNQTVPGTNVSYVPMPILTFALFLMFILLGSVVLVNLLVCKRVIFCAIISIVRRRRNKY